MLSLTVINSDNICSSYALDTTPGAGYRIGRSMDCEIALPEEIHLSRVHCILTIGEGCALLTDNNSSNGIFEDNNRVQEILMLPGKQYRAGNCKLMLELIPDSPPAEEPFYNAEPIQQEETAHEYEDILITSKENHPPVTEETPLPEETQPTPEAGADMAPAVEPSPVTEAPVPPEPEAESDSTAEKTSSIAQPQILSPEERPKHFPEIKPKRKFIPPPPRKALVKRAAPRPFYTAAGTLSTKTVVAKPKELKHRKPTNGIKLLRQPSQSASAIGLPFDFTLSMKLLNTTPTIEEGDILNFSITAEEDCHVFMIQYDCKRNGVMLVPGVGGADNTVKANQETLFPPKGNNKYELYVEPPFGNDIILAIACTHKVNFAQIWKNCLAQADELTTPGEVEKQAIQQCRESRGMENARWAAALLHIETGS